MASNLGASACLLATLLFCITTQLQADLQHNHHQQQQQQHQYPRQSFGSNLQRSYSDPRLNRNNSYQQQQGSFRRQSSYDRYRCNVNYKFDYVQLTLQWAPGSCLTSPHACTRIEDKHFTIHGMWPTITGTQEPSNCCFDNTFEYDKLKPILADLNNYWFSYFDQSSRHFWSHEWLKHGTCSRNIAALKGEELYFGTTVKLAKQLPILEVLKKNNVVPSKDNQKAAYPSSQIIDALKEITHGSRIQLSCDYEHQQPIPILTGLNFCYDSNLKLTDCPEMRTKCKRQVLFKL